MTLERNKILNYRASTAIIVATFTIITHEKIFRLNMYINNPNDYLSLKYECLDCQETQSSGKFWSHRDLCLDRQVEHKHTLYN